jgi:predicted phosphoribosyltransferase
VAREERELWRREQAYRGGRPPVEVAGRSIILVDDGLATGSTMRAAVEGLRRRGPRRIAVAVPVAATQTCEALAGEVDDILCAQTPEPFLAVGLWYQDFGQTTDEEVREVLEEAARRTEARAGAGEGAP